MDDPLRSLDDTIRERLLLAAAGGAQGLAIWLLIETWPESHAARAAAVSALTFLAVTAAVFHFAWTGSARARLLGLTLATGLLYAAVAGWVGWSLPLEIDGARGDQDRGFTWFLTSGATLYVLGPFLQIFQRTGRAHFPYRDLFLHGWNNFFVALVGALFVGALWAVLVLWAALFDLVGIELFQDLFSEEWFIWPVSGAAVGFGIALGRESERVVSTLRGITLAVFRGLLPLVAFVALIFLVTLPFTGLDGLWRTNHASQLLLVWVGLTVLFLNAVYQDGSGDEPLPGVVRRGVEAALLAMTVYVGIAVYGISLRIAQHGFTPERFWGVLFTVVLGSYAAGYAFAAVRGGKPWLRAVRAVNLFVALLVVVIGLAAHTPLLDPIGWSARSQFDRLASGRVDAALFDYGYLRFELGREGRERFEALEALEAHPEIATIRERVAAARAVETYWEWEQEASPGFGPGLFDGYPPGTEVPAALIEAARTNRQFWVRGACTQPGACAAFRLGIDAEPPDDWVLVIGHGGWSQIFVFSGDAEAGYPMLGQLVPEGASMPGNDDLRELLDALRFEAVDSPYRDVRIGDQRYRLTPSR